MPFSRLLARAYSWLGYIALAALAIYAGLWIVAPDKGVMWQWSGGDRLPDWSSAWMLQEGSVTDVLGILFGVIVFGYTVRVAQRQLLLMERQDIIINRQLTQEADLSVTALPPGPIDDWILCVKNSGTRGASEYYWHLYVPLSIVGHVDVDSFPQPGRLTQLRATIDGAEYMRFSDLVRKPAFPNMQIYCGRLASNVAMKAMTRGVPMSQETHVLEARWKVYGEDGEFPREGYGHLTVPLYRPSPVDNLSAGG